MHSWILTLSIAIILCYPHTTFADSDEANIKKETGHGFAVLATNFPEFTLNGVSLEMAIEQLCQRWAEIENIEAPFIPVYRYVSLPYTDANPWKMDERIHLHFKNKSGYEILKTLGDLTGFELRAAIHSVGLFQVPTLSGQTSSLEDTKELPEEMTEFLDFKLKQFNCDGITAVDALKQLQTSYESAASSSAPSMGLIYYVELDTPKDKPSMPELSRVHLALKDVPIREVLRYIGELANCHTQYNRHSIGLYQLAALHHPKPVYRISMKDIVSQYGQPSGNVEDWLMDKFDTKQVYIWSLRYHEGSGDVFIGTEPESMQKILPKKFPENQ